MLAAREYDVSVQPVLQNALTALTREPLRADMVISSYKTVVDQLMILMAAGGNIAEAAKYGRYLYKYAEDERKATLIEIFGAELILKEDDE